MEVTKDEQRKLDDLFRKIADRDEFVAQQRQAAETLRRKEAEPPVTVWAVVDRFTERALGKVGVEVCGVYLTEREAEDDLRLRYERVKGDIETKFFGEGLIFYDSIEELMHGFYIHEAPILSTFKTDGQPLPEDTVIFQKGVAEGRRLERQDNAKWSDEDEEMLRIIQNRLQKFSEWAAEQGYTKDAIKPKPEDWLASLRPRKIWVPSDEEISWLKTAYKLSKDKPSIHGIIGSLINGLESIKQEGQR